MKKDNNKSKLFWYFIGIGASLIILLIILSSVLNVGDRLRKISVYLEYAFYLLSVLLLYFLIINPIRIILFSPSFSITTVMDKDNKKKYKLYKSISKNIINSKILTDEEEEKLKNSMNDFLSLKQELQILYDDKIKLEINKIIINNSKTVMISTAICPNGRLDLLTVLSVNLKMIKEIVVVCGFRPTYKNLSKLTLKILTTALIAEGLENINLDEILPNSFQNAIGDIPLIKPVMSGTIQGITNALLTLRIGVVTRKYLFKEGSEVTKEEIRKSALKEAVKILPVVIKDSFKSVPNKFIKIFKKNDNQCENV